MPRKNSNSRVLRRLAEELVQRIADHDEVPDDERDDLVTSLVRQWITYDGCATVFFGEQQVHLVLGQTPLGKPVIPEPRRGKRSSRSVMVRSTGFGRITGLRRRR